MKIGFIGLGNVGGKLAESLLRNSFDLTVRDLDNMLNVDLLGLGGILVSGAMTWIPPVFLFVDYVINDRWTLYPWNSNRD